MLIFQRMSFNSFKARLLFSTFLMTIILLPIVGFTLSEAFEEQLLKGMENELKAYSYSILTVAEVENNSLIMPDMLLENQFNISQSGLYAMINSLKNNSKNIKNLWQSQSLLTMNDDVLSPQNLRSPIVGETRLTTLVLNGEPHLLFSFSVSFSDNGQSFPVTLHLIKSQQPMYQVLSHFNHKLWLWLALLMFLLLLVQLVWLDWTMKPLSTLRQELETIEQGKANVLSKTYPAELTQVTSQLNTLLSTEQKQRQRYRNALSDLAHSLKNPLAVIKSQPSLSSSSQEQVSLINNMIEHQLKRAQSAGESSWHLGVKIKPVIDKLIKTLAKIYQEKSLPFNVIVDDNLLFKGDEADLMEMLGNVLDNACKAAKNQVSIEVYKRAEKLFFVIEDDGVGVSTEQRQSILSRGHRADTYQAGHGIGLAIVRDLVASYHGDLRIEYSTKLQGAAFILSF